MGKGEKNAGRFSRYRTYLSKGLLPHKLLQMLGSAGIIVQPYHFYREDAPSKPRLPSGMEDSEIEFAEAALPDVDGLSALDPGTDERALIRADFAAGRRCFVLRKRGEIVASTWCNTSELSFTPLRRPLSGDEAYLYGMQTLYRYRGHDIAPYLRWKCIEFLGASGRRSVYSYSDYFNRPAVRFKEKIGARILFTGLYIGISGVGGKNWILRDHRTGISPEKG